MEEQWSLTATFAPTVHGGSLSRQNYSDTAGDMGGLDSSDGDHLFIASRTPISAVRACAFILGFAFNLHDQPFCRKNRSGCSASASCRGIEELTRCRGLRG